MSTESPFVFKKVSDVLFDVLYNGHAHWGALEYLDELGWLFSTKETRLTPEELAHIALKLFELNGQK